MKILFYSSASLAYKSSQEEADVAEGEEDDLESTVEIDEIISSDANEADLTVEEMMVTEKLRKQIIYFILCFV